MPDAGKNIRDRSIGLAGLFFRYSVLFFFVIYFFLFFTACWAEVVHVLK